MPKGQHTLRIITMEQSHWDDQKLAFWDWRSIVLMNVLRLRVLNQELEAFSCES